MNFRAAHLINDLEAVARAVPVLQPPDLLTLKGGEPVATGPIAVIAPGTGLGESFLTWHGAQYVAHSSEGGHSDFAPTDQRQIRLLEYLLQRFDHVGVERVCSGIGVPNIYDYLRDEEQIPEPPDVARVIASANPLRRAVRTCELAGFGAIAEIDATWSNGITVNTKAGSPLTSLPSVLIGGCSATAAPEANHRSK